MLCQLAFACSKLNKKIETPKKCVKSVRTWQYIRGFLTFSVGTEKEHWCKVDQRKQFPVRIRSKCFMTDFETKHYSDELTSN